MKLWDKIINGVLAGVLFGSIIWFVMYEHDKFDIPTYEVPEQILDQPEKIDWAPLIPGISSVAIFFLRYFLFERKKKKLLVRPPLSDHLNFDTIEDMLENDVRHKHFGSEGRTEAMRCIITIQLDTYRDILKEFIYDNPKFIDATDFRKKLRACIFHMVEETTENWKERQLPQPLIDKYSALYKHRIDLLLADVLSSTFMADIETNEALNTFLNDARIIFRSGLLEDVVLALRSMNGELSGLTFNGKKL